MWIVRAQNLQFVHVFVFPLLSCYVVCENDGKLTTVWSSTVKCI